MTIYEKAIFLRDTYFDNDGSREFFREIISKPKGKEIYDELRKMDIKTLYLNAKKLINNLEHGKYNEKELELAELKITLYLAAIDDYEKNLILEKTLKVNRKPKDSISPDVMNTYLTR